MSEPLELNYDLFDLPTAQHRAGLAGLLTVIKTLERRGASDLPAWSIPMPGLLHLKLTQESLRTLLNEIYDAALEEVRQNSLRKDRAGRVVPPLRTETVTEVDKRSGKLKDRMVYVYHQVVPRAQCLAILDMPELWLKLWRDTLWSTLRAVPKTRTPFEQRAAGLDAQEGDAVWRELQRWKRNAAGNQQYVAEVASSMFLGAQAENAEKVPFRGHPDENLLLHFWTTVMGVGEARALKLKDGDVSEEATGFVIAVPDVVDLESFVADFAAAVSQLGRERAGYRPRDGIVSLPQEGALEYLRHLGMISRGRYQQGELAFSVAGIDVYHLTRRGNNVVVLGAGRVPASRALVHQYERIREQYPNLLFRSQLIGNLLRGRPWYSGFDRVFATRSQELFFGGGPTPFATSASRRFQAERASSAGGGLR